MGECIQKIFLTDEGALPCSTFDEQWVYEGTSLYEVIRVMDGVPVFIDDHIERLFYSGRSASLEIWHTRTELKENVHYLMKQNHCYQGNVKLVFHYPEPFEQASRRFLAYFIPHYYPTREQYRKGVRAITYPAVRENPMAKLVNKNLRLEVYHSIIERGAYEAILVNPQGFLTEGSRSNFFAIRKNILITAPDEYVLPGISRKYILQLCREKKIRVSLSLVHRNKLAGMDGAFISGTSPKVLPLSGIDDHHFPAQHPLIQELMKAYDTLIRNYILTYNKE